MGTAWGKEANSVQFMHDGASSSISWISDNAFYGCQIPLIPKSVIKAGMPFRVPDHQDISHFVVPLIVS